MRRKLFCFIRTNLWPAASLREGRGRTQQCSWTDCRRFFTVSGFLRLALTWLLGIPLLAGCVRTDGAVWSGARCSHYPVWGEYGGNLNLLRCFYTPPQAAGESNYFIDMQGKEPLRNFAVAHGLTNNHALFVLCHGRAIDTPCGCRYAFFGGKDDRNENSAASFSIQDIAGLLGPVNASQIHNLVLASCNRENMLCPAEIRAYFPYVTNLTHALPETDAQLNTFHHALTYPSRDIDFLYAMPDTFTLGVFEHRKSGKRGTRKLVPYVADLYLPGAKKPYSRQTAGRELLQGR